MAAILTTDFAALTDDLQEVFQEAAKNKVAEAKGKELFDIKDTNRRTYDLRTLHGLGGITAVAEGEDFPSVSTNQGRQTIALAKSSLINGETLKTALQQFMATLKNLEILGDLQRLSEKTTRFA